jgi:hypothetical protein
VYARNGVIHRENGPAVIFNELGNKSVYVSVINGVINNIGNKMAIYIDNDRWCSVINGVVHSDDGYAISLRSGQGIVKSTCHNGISRHAIVKPHATTKRATRRRVLAKINTNPAPSKDNVVVWPKINTNPAPSNDYPVAKRNTLPAAAIDCIQRAIISKIRDITMVTYVETHHYPNFECILKFILEKTLLNDIALLSINIALDALQSADVPRLAADHYCDTVKKLLDLLPQ